MLSQLLQFQSPIYYVLTKEAWLWRGWGTGGGTPYPLRDEKSCLHHWFVAWKTVIRWCCALKTIRKLAFLVITKPKDASCSWIYPRQYIYRKNWAIISLVVIRSTFVIRARLKFAWLISLEFYQNDTKKLMQMILSYYVINIQLKACVFWMLQDMIITC